MLQRAVIAYLNLYHSRIHRDDPWARKKGREAKVIIGRIPIAIMERIAKEQISKELDKAFCEILRQDYF